MFEKLRDDRDWRLLGIVYMRKLKKIVGELKILVIFASNIMIKAMRLRKLTKKEEVIMNIFWEKGGLFIKELRDEYPEPKPHVNTISTQVRTLEADGFVGHKSYGPTYQYFPAISKEEYSKSSLSQFMDKIFGNSYIDMVSSLVEEEKISVEELKSLIELIENKK